MIIAVISVTLIYKGLEEALWDNAGFEDSVPIYPVLWQEGQTVDLGDHDVVKAWDIDVGQCVKIVAIGFVVSIFIIEDKSGESEL